GLQEKKKASADAWPGSFENLFFYWQNRSKANTFADPVAQFSCVCRAEAKGRARYGRHFEMAPSGGAFIADGGAGELIEKCAASGQLAVEVMITPDTNLKEQLLPIVGYAAKTGNWNFLLGQKENQLIFQMSSEKTEKNYTLTLGVLASNVPNHIIVSCSSSSVACYLNGKQISCHDSVFGGNWERGSIVFGNELQDEYAVNQVEKKSGWKGLIENVALNSRWIGPEEARNKYSASVAAITERKPLPVLSVEAKLISMPVIPAPESIAPYRRALAVGQYRIEQVTEGTCSNREVMVAQWAILDGQTLKSAQNQKGRKYRLRLEQFSDHPELEGERQIMDNDRFDLPLYFDVGD
ncbi:MAG: LamG-like jellyroll fold domain-containing protein, partial [bacterium]|nr:LamG-like jellyroll fold domain-containing protein [bacterium]